MWENRFFTSAIGKSSSSLLARRKKIGERGVGNSGRCEIWHLSARHVSVPQKLKTFFGVLLMQSGITKPGRRIFLNVSSRKREIA